MSTSPQIMETVMTNAQMICGQVSCLIDGVLCELELVCDEHPVGPLVTQMAEYKVGGRES